MHFQILRNHQGYIVHNRQCAVDVYDEAAQIRSRLFNLVQRAGGDEAEKCTFLRITYRPPAQTRSSTLSNARCLIRCRRTSSGAEANTFPKVDLPLPFAPQTSIPVDIGRASRLMQRSIPMFLMRTTAPIRKDRPRPVFSYWSR